MPKLRPSRHKQRISCDDDDDDDDDDNHGRCQSATDTIGMLASHSAQLRQSVTTPVS